MLDLQNHTPVAVPQLSQALKLVVPELTVLEELLLLLQERDHVDALLFTDGGIRNGSLEGIDPRRRWTPLINRFQVL